MTDPPAIHPDFYPATSEVRWEPLQAVLPAERIGEFMFMMADPGGRFYYKHSDTRGYVVVNDAGVVFDPEHLIRSNPCAPEWDAQ